jgi:lysyl-tRNA synthetase class 1
VFWADKWAKEIIKSGKYKPYWVDDMKTPSGRIHVGSLLGVVIHDNLHKALLAQGQKAVFTYCINDMDSMDGFPVYLDRDKFYKYMGTPLCKIPSPEPGFASFAEYFAKEFIGVFNKIGCQPKIIWTHELYAQGKFDELIKTSLDQTAKIRELYKEQYKNFKPEEFFPYQPICPQCGKISTTKVSKWDGEYVYFECKKDAVTYTEGCGYKGKVRPEKQNGKMPYKIEWPAHWKLLGITIEWSGKDHMTKGGSHEIAAKICEQIFHYPTPNAELYEHVLIGGKKMSSSKGFGASAKEMSEILPPEVLRFFLSKTHYRRTIDFDPAGNTIPKLFDEYDSYAKTYYQDKNSDLAKVWQLCQVKEIPEKEFFLPRFRDVANYLQSSTVDIYEKFKQIKGTNLTSQEKTILEERIKYAKLWLKSYAPEELVYEVSPTLPKEAASLTSEQKKYLVSLISLISQKPWQPEELQQQMYELTKKLNIPTKQAFQAIYLSLIGKNFGPKAAWFILGHNQEKLLKRFAEVGAGKTTTEKKQYSYPVLNHPEILSINKTFKDKYPSVTVGLAIIKGVTIKKADPKLIKEVNEFLANLKGLTTETINTYPEVLSYRRIYKETGIDWHSRRPSPEALLRRIATGKGIYSVNTCVDAYNLIVMKNRVSNGAFDYDRFKFPTVLRFARPGEKILLLGDDKPTEYKEGEVAYFDALGGYNIDFNYRDAQRTKVTEQTKNILLNVDGVYDVTREKVEQTLKESIDIIIKYCGGKLEIAGIVE